MTSPSAMVEHLPAQGSNGRLPPLVRPNGRPLIYTTNDPLVSGDSDRVTRLEH